MSDELLSSSAKPKPHDCEWPDTQGRPAWDVEDWTCPVCRQVWGRVHDCEIEDCNEYWERQ